ncbi:MAG: ATP-binding cassette domain-containing protein, partial [Clostridia bacterium]|nr:ATP-binding cassette domain-containing protein [Clostridia bacterium]
MAKAFLTPSGQRYTAVADVTLDVGEGEFLTVVGPTGCGKSTLLNMAAGLLAPSAGRIEVFGEALIGLNRHAAYLFQQDALLPWRTVLDNVALGLRFRGVPRREAERAAREWIARVGLAGFEDRFPHQLSGGMRKRVALAQTWIVDPRILLMDEPFSSLD